MNDQDFSHLAVLSASDGEEHVAEVLLRETAGSATEAGTDNRVPGRLLGRQAEYEKIGADAYVIESEFHDKFFSSSFAAELFWFNITAPFFQRFSTVTS